MILGQLAAQTAEQDDHYKKTSKWQGRIRQNITQLQKSVNPEEDSFAISSNDLKELPLHMVSTPKLERIPPPHVSKIMPPIDRIYQLLDKEINDNQTIQQSEESMNT